MIRDTYDKSIQDNVVERIRGLAGKKRNQVRNPCITAREAVALADYLVELESKLKEPKYKAPDMAMFKEKWDGEPADLAGERNV